MKEQISKKVELAWTKAPYCSFILLNILVTSIIVLIFNSVNAYPYILILWVFVLNVSVSAVGLNSVIVYISFDLICLLFLLIVLLLGFIMIKNQKHLGFLYLVFSLHMVSLMIGIYYTENHNWVTCVGVYSVKVPDEWYHELLNWLLLERRECLMGLFGLFVSVVVVIEFCVSVIEVCGSIIESCILYHKSVRFATQVVNNVSVAADTMELGRMLNVSLDPSHDENAKRISKEMKSIRKHIAMLEKNRLIHFTTDISFPKLPNSRVFSMSKVIVPMADSGIKVPPSTTSEEYRKMLSHFVGKESKMFNETQYVVSNPIPEGVIVHLEPLSENRKEELLCLERLMNRNILGDSVETELKFQVYLESLGLSDLSLFDNIRTDPERLKQELEKVNSMKVSSDTVKKIWNSAEYLVSNGIEKKE